MKKMHIFNRSTQIKASVIALAISGTFAIQAHAQTNVTVYGRVVAGLDYQNNVATGANTTGSLWRQADNQWGTSFLGFKGEEDLGGGLKASFDLETGFGTATGAGNGPALFNRKAYVGIGSAEMGTLKLGEDLTIADGSWDLDPMGHEFIGVETLNNGRNWGGGSINNIEYFSPNWGGFSIFTQLGLGEVAGSSTASQQKGIQATFARSNYMLRAQYDDRRDTTGRFSDLFTFSKVWTLGGTVTLDKMKLLGGYQHFSAPDQVAGSAVAGTTGSPNSANQEWIGLNYQTASPLLLRAAFYHVNLNNGAGHANLYSAGVDYALSKRTVLYAGVGTVRNSAQTSFSVEASNNRPLAGQSQFGGYAGVSVSF